jgi:hypothetical protein
LGKNSLTSDLLDDPDPITSNRAGKITRDQANALRTKVSAAPGWMPLITGVLFTVLACYVVYEKIDILRKSTDLEFTLGVIVVGVIVAAGIITAVIEGLIGKRRMRQLKGMAVDATVGKVVWDNGVYVPRTEDQVLEPVTALDLTPGDYTFYVGHGTNWLLSAEPIRRARQSPMTVDQFHAMLKQPLPLNPEDPQATGAHLAALSQALGQFDLSRLTASEKDAIKESIRARMEQIRTFVASSGGFRKLYKILHALHQESLPPLDDAGLRELNHALQQSGVASEADLASNRQGRLTSRQRRTLLSELRFDLSNAFILLGVAVAVLYFGRQRSELIGYLSLSGFFLFLAVIMLSAVHKQLSDWLSGRVMTDQGRVTLDAAGHSGNDVHYFRLGNNNFEVPYRAIKALLPEYKYRLYYTPKSHRLVNIEPIA